MEVSTLASVLIGAIKDLAEREGSFRVDVLAPGTVGAEAEINICPCDPGCASIWLAIDDDSVTGRFGEYVIADFFPSRKSPVLKIADIVVEYCVAVIQGNYQEALWSHGDRVVAGVGVFTLPDGTRETARTNKVLPFSFRAPRINDYPPYTRC